MIERKKAESERAEPVNPLLSHERAFWRNANSFPAECSMPRRFSVNGGANVSL